MTSDGGNREPLKWPHQEQVRALFPMSLHNEKFSFYLNVRVLDILIYEL